jgi:HEXXH motif-containing protein
MHIGHLHAVAAAVAIHAGLRFDSSIPVWSGGAMLPTVGLARFAVDSPHSVAEVHGEPGQVELSNETTRIRLPEDLTTDAPGRWGMRRLTPRAGRCRLSVWLDDLDPYRGLYEPVLPQRLDTAEVDTWCALLNSAWQLIVHYLPHIADALSVRRRSRSGPDIRRAATP